MDKLPEFLSNHPMLAIAAGAVLGLIIINEWRIRTRGFASLNSDELVLRLNSGAQVLDVRADKDFKTGHILNAINLPQDNLESIDRFIKDKAREIVVVCDTGFISPRIADKLKKLDFQKVAMLKGGIAAWKQDSLPVVTQQKEKKDKQKKKGNKGKKSKSEKKRNTMTEQKTTEGQSLETERQIAHAKVTMYTKLVCPYCVRAKQLLEHKNVEFEEIRVDTNPEKLDEMLARSNGARTVPQIFIGDTYVGGSDDMYALHRADKLDALLYPSTP